MAIQFGVTFTGTPDANDKLGAIAYIDLKNQEIQAANDALAEGEELTPLYEYDTNAKLKTSYEAILSNLMQNAHNDYVAKAIAADRKNLASAYDSADGATQDQVRALLGVQ